ncbi:MAG: hypothetical protein ABSE47_07835 [Acidimicrobiales bacterium]
MQHVPDGKLRRLVDEPFAVADADAGHVARCDRCRSRHREIRQNAAEATVMLSRPHPVPDLEIAWSAFTAGTSQTAVRSSHVPARSPRRRAVTVTLPSLRAMVAAAVLVAVAATGGTLAAILSASSAPSRQASSANFQAIEELAGVSGGSGSFLGFGTSAGSLKLPFGVLRWSSSGTAHSAASLAAAAESTGLQLRTPASLPAGVGTVTNILVQPRVTATIRFGTDAGTLAGKSLSVSAGPAVLVEYGGGGGELGLPTLATFTMERPTLSSNASTPAQLEAYVLSAPGVPAGLDQELRLIGDAGTVLPFQAPSGTDASQVDVDGAAGILVTAPTIGAAGVIWVSHGLVHAIVGLLDGKDILHVAGQIG